MVIQIPTGHQMEQQSTSQCKEINNNNTGITYQYNEQQQTEQNEQMQSTI